MNLEKPIAMTPEEAYLITDSSDLPEGIYGFLDGLLSLYQVETESNETRANAVFMLATAFVAGCSYTTETGGRFN